jgi:hypothetical protein
MTLLSELLLLLLYGLKTKVPLWYLNRKSQILLFLQKNLQAENILFLQI